MTERIPMTEEQRQEWQDNAQSAAASVMRTMMMLANDTTGSTEVSPVIGGIVVALAEFGVRAGIDQEQMRQLITETFDQAWPQMVMGLEANTLTTGTA